MTLDYPLRAYILRFLAWALRLDPERAFPEALDPLERITTLEDDPDKCHLWVLDEETTDSQRLQLSEELHDAYYQAYRRQPHSLHFVVNNVDEIQTLEKDEVRRVIAPWMKQEVEA